MLKKNNSGYVCGVGSALVAAMVGLYATTPRESVNGDGINTAVIPALQRRANAHRRKRNRRVR